MSRGTTAIINLAHLKHNYTLLKKQAPNKLVLVIKADAYGHGIKRVIQTLGTVDCYAVATIEEALLIRRYNQEVKILLLEGFLDANELETAFENNFDCVIHQIEQIKLLQTIASSKTMNIWSKLDSGMNRLGFNTEQFQSAIKILEKHPNVQDIILMSHFASADDNTNTLTQKQTEMFLQIDKAYPTYQQSLSNTSALLNHKNLKDEWCRVGLALFGVSPIANKQAQDFGLKPVMTLKTNIIAIKNIGVNQGIGYSHAYVSTKPMKIAIIGIGYGDGYPWNLTCKASVKVNGIPAQIVGRVSMDMLAIDVSTINNLKVGDSVLVWGQDKKSELPLETVASHAQTIPYVLLCQITSRVHYNYV